MLTQQSEQERVQHDMQLMQKLIDSPYIPITPTAKQWAFILDERREILYGGAAGGGKSIALLAAALLHVDVPSYRALVLRRTFQDLILPGALMDIADQWLRPTDAKRKQVGREWHFPSGAVLTFGYMANEGQKYRYQGAAFNFVGWDETTQFSEAQYTYLFSRCRHSKGQREDIPDRIRCCSNPGGIGHDWVKARFIDALPPEKERERLFIPATLHENPYLDVNAYLEMLNELDPVTRAQLENGNWDIRPSGNFFLPKIRAVALHESNGNWKRAQRCRAWDLAATETGDYAVGLLLARDRNARLWRVEDVVRVRAEPAKIERVLTETAKRDGSLIPQVIEQETGSAGKFAMRDLRTRIFHGSPVFAMPTTGNKLTRARLAASIVAAGDMEMAPAGWNSEFISELIGFGGEQEHDDQVDALAHATHWLVKQGGADKPRTTVTESQEEVAQKPKRLQQSKMRIVR